VTNGSGSTTATLAALGGRRACPPLTALPGDRGNREDGNEPGEQGESSHGDLLVSLHHGLLSPYVDNRHDRSRSSAMERSRVASPSWTWAIPRWSSSSVQGTCNNRSTKSSVRDSKTWEIDRRRRRGVCPLITPDPFFCVLVAWPAGRCWDTQHINVTAKGRG
jgi:hypothetical protein